MLNIILSFLQLFAVQGQGKVTKCQLINKGALHYEVSKSILFKNPDSDLKLYHYYFDVCKKSLDQQKIKLFDNSYLHELFGKNSKNDACFFEQI